jgi:hypothetical protein
VYVPDAAATLGAVRADVIGWGDLAARRSILVFVQMFENMVAEGQSQLLFHPGGYFRGQRADAATFADLLRANGGIQPPG